MFDKENKENLMLTNANHTYFKTFRCNRQSSLDKLMHDFCANKLPKESRVINESTSSFYIPLYDLPQEVNTQKRPNLIHKIMNLLKGHGSDEDNYNRDWSQATKNYFQANQTLQPIQFVGTITYTKPNNDND